MAPLCVSPLADKRSEWLKIPSGEDKGQGKKRKNGLRQSREEKFTNSCLQDGDVLSRFFKEGTLKRKKRIGIKKKRQKKKGSTLSSGKMLIN